MKKTSFFAICILIISVFVCTPSFSVTIDDIDGTWDTWSKAKLSFSGVGSFSDENPSETVLDLAGNFALTETNDTGTYNYSGDFSIEQEKKLLFSLDAPGTDELVRTWRDWTREIAYDKGASTITDIGFSNVIITYSSPKISKRSGIPGKAKIKAKGWASAIIDGDPITKRFSYKSTVTFLGLR